ncbi:BREX system ATP-binding domain-containing protein [Gemmatimonas sp.]|uniref:BREX system ATP-binding domain-containing protein n=1 Tax=Gemmatimonas sp. TaxID=1962908 RepID=UPI0035645B4E
MAGLAQTGTPGGEVALLLDIGTTEFLEYFSTEVLDELVSSGGAACRFFEGAFGAGKTHLLSLLHSLAVARGMAVVRVDLSHALSLEDWPAITRYILEKLELVVDGRREVSLPRILEALARNGTAETTRLAATSLPHGGFARAMRLMASDPLPNNAAFEALQAYLLGEPVTQATLRAAGIRGVRGALGNRSAELVLRTVVNGLRALGVAGTVLLFDEAERAFRVRGGHVTQKVVAAANLMRRFIDACTTGGLSGVLAVFAVLPGFVDDCALAYDALGQRLTLMPDDEYGRIAWRSPVLPIERLTTLPDRAAFLTATCERMTTLAARCGLDENVEDTLRRELLHHGRLALEGEAGSGYRRGLMKRVATVCLSHLSPSPTA